MIERRVTKASAEDRGLAGSVHPEASTAVRPLEMRDVSVADRDREKVTGINNLLGPEMGCA